MDQREADPKDEKATHATPGTAQDDIGTKEPSCTGGKTDSCRNASPVTNNWGTLAERGILLVTAIYAVFAGLQWCALRESIEITKRAVTIGDRAWIMLANVDGLPNTPSCTGGIPIKVTVKNAGKTPAMHLTMDFQMAFSSGLLNDDTFVERPRPAQNMPLGIGDTTDGWTSTPEWDPRICEAIVNKARKLYFLGDIRYSDVFEPTNVRRTEFCYVYRPDAKRWGICLNNVRME